MDYVAHYARLIDRARGRVIEGYCERHHVVPRCLGGSNKQSNLVDLFPEEHYVAHQLLVKLNPGHVGIAYAAVLMAKQSSRNKAYGWLRRRLSDGMRGTKRRLGMKHSPESRARMSAVKLGVKYPNRKRAGPHSEEHRAKISAAGKGHKLSPEHREKLIAANKARPLTTERLAMLAAMRNKKGPVSEETKAKMSAAMRGRKIGPMPEDRKKKLSAALKARWAEGKCWNQWTRPR